MSMHAIATSPGPTDASLRCEIRAGIISTITPDTGDTYAMSISTHGSWRSAKMFWLRVLVAYGAVKE